MFNHVFKDIDDKSTIIDKNIVNYTHNLTTSSIGVQSTKIVLKKVSLNIFKLF